MLRTLSLVEWEIRSAFSYTVAFCGGNPLSRRTSRRAEPRYIGLRVSEFWRQALAVPSVWSLSGQGPEPFPHPGRELQAQTRGEQRPALGGASGNGFEI